MFNQLSSLMKAALFYSITLGLILLLALAALLPAACGSSSGDAAPTEPAVVSEEIEGSELKRITLSASAAQRLGVETAPVTEQQISGATRAVIPYSAIVYDASGDTWAYTNVDGLTFVRQAVEVDHIEGDMAVLAGNATPDAPVVTVGAAELYGVETGVGGGH